MAQWLRCCATNRKVAGSIPAGVIGTYTTSKLYLYFIVIIINRASRVRNSAVDSSYGSWDFARRSPDCYELEIITYHRKNIYRLTCQARIGLILDMVV